MKAIWTALKIKTLLKAEFEIDWPLKPKDKDEAKDWLAMSWTPVQDR